MRSYFSFGLSVLIFFVCYLILETFLKMVGAETYIDFGETIWVSRGSGRFRDDYLSDGEGTDLGLAILLLSLFVAVRGYHICLSGKWSGDFKPASLIQWNCWALGLGCFVLLTAPLYQPLEDPLYGVYKIAIGFACARFFYLRCEKEITELKRWESEKTTRHPFEDQ